MMPDGPRNTLRKSQAQRQKKHKEMGKEGGMMVELSTENYRIQIQCHIFFSRVFFGWHSFNWVEASGFTSLGSVHSRHIPSKTPFHLGFPQQIY